MSELIFYTVVIVMFLGVIGISWVIAHFWARWDTKSEWERERQRRHAMIEEAVREYRLAQLNKKDV